MQAFVASSPMRLSSTPMWYSHSRQISSPVQSRMAFLTKLPSRSVCRPYTHTSTVLLSWLLNCGWRLMVQERYQFSVLSFTVTIPPVVTLPARGSRLQIFIMWRMTSSSAVATVALIQLVASTSLQKASGLPYSPCRAWAAMVFHISQDSPQPLWMPERSGAWVWSP